MFYISSTSDLRRRLLEHRRGKSSFSASDNLKDLVYYESFPSIREAKAREKELKSQHRQIKISSIREKNPKMKDLTDEVPAMKASDEETNSA